MSSQFQNRLVGTVILIAVAVIVLPDIFDGKKEHTQSELNNVLPLQPPIKQQIVDIELKEPETPTVKLPESPVDVVDEESQPERTETISQDTQVLVPKVVVGNKNFKKRAWIIQLAALKNHKNAQTLVDDLKKRGYMAQLKQDKNVNRVIIGPNLSKEQLKEQIKQLQKITGLHGQLQVFKPLNI